MSERGENLYPSASEDFERRAARLSLLIHVGEVINSALELDRILEKVVHWLQKSFGYYYVGLFLPDETHGTLRLTARAGAFASLFPPDHCLKINQGLVGWASQHQTTVLANDVQADPRYVNFYPDRILTRSELAVPIVADDHLYGVIDVQSPVQDAFVPEDIRVIETVAHQLAMAMINASLYAEVRNRLAEQERAEAMMRIQRDLLAELTLVHDYQAMIEAIVRSLEKVSALDCGSIFLVDNEGGLDLIAHCGISAAFAGVVSYHPPEAPKSRFVQKGKPLYLPYARLELDPRIPSEIRNQENILFLVEVPIAHQSRVIANLTLGSHTRTDLPPNIRELIESIAAHLGAIIARVQAEHALAESQAHLSALLEALPDLYFVVDGRGRFLGCKKSTETGFFVPPEQFLGKTVDEVLPPEVAGPALENLRLSLGSHSLREMNYQLYSPAHQREEYFEARISPVNDDTAIILVRNITAHVLAEQERENRERVYRALFEQNKDAVLLMDMQGRYIDANRVATELTGYTREELLQMTFHQLVHPTEMSLAISRFEALLAGEQLPVYERLFVHKNGEPILCEVNTARVDDASGKPLHIQSILRDIRHRKSPPSSPPAFPNQQQEETDL
ncbi:MAG TPA: PAS domain S-box protein [Anaerolinea thermolimosa]|uniref:PAS domain S-box protein n=1 Tax=Anaerolinea thermolimosa TaxID=229919 RepID=A0A3D1JEE5_9CHLR|nr:GAF domain-containing protein [Anaerolinea thermolimosa]GAP07648.1 protein containing PAS domain S-box [Anaerolinea thermolimosa]HCE16627.1 PAS domain S-box protein [Anaerolinea thermolimosa]